MQSGLQLAHVARGAAGILSLGVQSCRGSGGESPPVGFRGEAPVGGLRDEVPQKPKHFLQLVCLLDCRNATKLLCTRLFLKRKRLICPLTKTSVPLNSTFQCFLAEVGRVI